MTTFDLLALAVIAMTTLISLSRGLVSEVTSLFTWVVAFVLARMFGQTFASLLLPSVQSPLFAGLIGFVAVFFLAFVVQYFFRAALNAAVSAVGLGKVNALLGAVFGAARGILMVSFAVLLCAFTELPRSADWQHAKTAPFFEACAAYAVPYLPEYLAQKVHYPKIPAESAGY